MPNTPVQATGEAMPAVTSYSLSARVYRYRAEWNAYLANSLEAGERGESYKISLNYEPSLKVIEEWSRPAQSLCEALLALDLAIEEYESGDTPVIPAMMKAALGWMKAEVGRRGAR